MQWLKSLFCFKGADNNERFIIICGFCVSLVLLLQIIAPSAAIFNGIIALCLTVAFIATSIRRTLDVGGDKRYSIFASISFILFVLGMLCFTTGGRFIAFVLPVLPVLFLFSLPSKQRLEYVSGYNGPINLAVKPALQPQADKNRSNRIEPSLFGEANYDSVDEFAVYSESSQGSTHTASATDSVTVQPSWLNNQAEVLYSIFVKKQRVVIVVNALVHLIVIISFFFSIEIPNQDLQEPPADKVENSIAHSATNPVIREHRLEMPDDFYLYLDNYHGLIIHWKADMAENGVIWSLASATGDDTCTIIEFNRGDSIRTVNVVIENNGDYYANFSPLDSEKIVKLLAKRGSFSLCGYTFSLKGSQKALNSNPAYIDMAN